MMGKKLFPFFGCFQFNPFRCRKAAKHGQDVQILTISTVIKSVRYRGKIAVFRIFRRFGSLVDVSGTVVWLVFMHFLLIV